MTGYDTTLQRLSLRVAILTADVGKAEAALAAARTEAETVFAQARRHGYKQQAVEVPDGGDIGLVSIHAGGTAVTVDEDALLLHVAVTDPGEVEDYVLPAALHDKRVLDLLSEFIPELTGARIKAPARTRLQAELEERGGYVADLAAGELVKVATVEHLEPTGRFTYRPTKQAAIKIAAALEAGTLTRNGEITTGTAEHETPVSAVLPSPPVPWAPPADLDDAAIAASFRSPPFADEDGFLDPQKAAAHAVVVQGGFTTPPIEAYRMLRSGGVMAERATAWLAEHGLDPADPREGKDTPWPLPGEGTTDAG